MSYFIADPLSVAREAGITIIDDPSIQEGYFIERTPIDPTTPGSPDVDDHSFCVRAHTPQAQVAGAVHVILERLIVCQQDTEATNTDRRPSCRTTSRLIVDALSDSTHPYHNDTYRCLPPKKRRDSVTWGHFSSPLSYRALHLDAGRHYFSRRDLVSILNMMAWCRLNTLNLHFSETHGYRLQSRIHPEIVHQDHLTFDDIDYLRSYAGNLGITIIPSFDMPGHLNGVLEAHPWARLRSSDGTEYPGALDITHPRARQLVWDLLDEVIDVFHASTVTIGGDEFLDFQQGVDVLENLAHERYGQDAGENDVWIDFLNTTIERLCKRGIKPYVFNDGIRVNRCVNLDPRAGIHYWTRWGAHMAPPHELEQAGYELTNWDGEELYFVMRHQPAEQQPTFDSVYTNFDPYVFPDKAGAYRVSSPQGACFSIWCDEPDALTSQQVIDLVYDPLFAFGIRLWPIGRERDAYQLQEVMADLVQSAFSMKKYLER